MNEELQLSVKRGAYFLDEHYPNWATTIRLDKLKMDQCANCIVGQAIGEYSSSIAAACGVEPYSKAAFAWAIDNGFDVPDESMRGQAEECYQELEVLWTEQVKARVS